MRSYLFSFVMLACCCIFYSQFGRRLGDCTSSRLAHSSQCLREGCAASTSTRCKDTHFEFMIMPAAKAASPGKLAQNKLNFQVVIKSAASAASPTAWEAPGRRGTVGRRGRPDDGTVRTTATGRSPSRRGGCASSRLDHGLKVWLE